MRRRMEDPRLFQTVKDTATNYRTKLMITAPIFLFSLFVPLIEEITQGQDLPRPAVILGSFLTVMVSAGFSLHNHLCLDPYTLLKPHLDKDDELHTDMKALQLECDYIRENIL